MSSGRRRAWRSRHRVKLGSGWIVAMVIMLAAAMLFTGAVILGNHLRAEAEATDGVSAGDETTLPDFDASSVPDVIALCRILRTALRRRHLATPRRRLPAACRRKLLRLRRLLLPTINITLIAPLCAIPRGICAIARS